MARPRVLFVGRTRYDLPLPASLARKWDAVSREVDVRVVGAAGRVAAGDPRFRLLPARGPRGLDGAAFYAALPAVVRAEARRHRPDVVVTQSPYEAFALLPGLRGLRPRPALVVEVHGDWRIAARLYGSRRRRVIAGLSDRAALIALRRATGTRALTGYTAALAEAATGRPPLALFPTYFDLRAFLERPPVPPPDVPTALWVGVLDRTKNPDGFARAWRRVAERLPDARLIVAGRGPMRGVIDDLARDLPGRVEHHEFLEPAVLVGRFDAASALVLPSRSEGMGRVILEAFARARPVVATRVGGIPDLVAHEENGLLVAPEDDAALADALVRVLGDRALAARLGERANADVARHLWTAERYAAATRAMAERALALRA
ncbi:MAG: glycosyltransferase family 4 protein [Gemmatimonadaceae bacterium]